MFELYYTSAPAGLRPNTHGFCTVATTDGLPRQLFERLEGLSTYRHQFAEGAGHPVAHAFWMLTVGGQQFKVVSRVGDAGMDYTHRTNAFSHHVVLEAGDVAGAAGADAVELFTYPGFMKESWDGVVAVLPRRAMPRLGVRSAKACGAWSSAAGDAGYAGLIAEAFVRNGQAPVCIVYAPGMPMLPLIGEVLGLVPAALRWSVTFNTYFTSLPTSASCAWRCCLAKTPAADAAKRYAAGGLILDLTDRGKLPALPANNPWVAFARGSGRSPADGPVTSPAVATHYVAPAKTAPVVEVAEEDPEILIAGPAELHSDERIAISRGQLAPGRPLTPGLLVGAEERVTTPANKNVDRRRWSTTAGLVVGAILIVVLAAVGFYMGARAFIPAPSLPGDGRKTSDKSIKNDAFSPPIRPLIAPYSPPNDTKSEPNSSEPAPGEGQTCRF